MKRPYLALIILWSGLTFLVAPAASAQTDPFQRYFIFHNQLSHPIYPVIQGPVSSNCGPSGSTDLLRIYVNDKQRGAGVPANGGTVRVNIPKTQPCSKSGFYDAARVFVFLADVEKFEALVAAKGDKNQQAQDLRVDWAKDICPNLNDLSPACWVGLAKGAYLPDAPANLLEYTIISQVGNAKSTKDQNDPDGTPVLDFDVSYVDEVYLPITMAVDGGITAYMGSKLSFDEFNTALASFATDAQTKWSRFAAYTDKNWPTTIFNGLVPRTDKLPSASTILANTRKNDDGVLPASGYYNYAVAWDGTPARCQPERTFNQMCKKQNALGDDDHNCCPDSGMRGGRPVAPPGPLGCCDIINFTIDQVSRRWTDQGKVPLDKNFGPTSNPTTDDLVARWTKWTDKKVNCKERPPADTPVLPADQVAFCTAFSQTVNFVFDEFVLRDKNAGGPCTGKGLRPDEYKQCIVTSITGYDIKSGYDPEKCKKPPFDPSCGEEKQRNESVQALFRGLPYTGFGSPAKCAGCPSLEGAKCPIDICVFPSTPIDGAKVYHYDKFLHFWPRYDSVYNLNPYARFVHDTGRGQYTGSGKLGLAAPGAYSFSIDDFYGNFGGPGSGLIINVGGTQFLPNKSAYDPFTQYFVGWQFWDHADVCGRRVSFKDKTLGRNYPISFWNNGTKTKSCEITLYADAGGTKFVKFLITEMGRDPDDPNDHSPEYLVTDSYTGKQWSVLGLGGVFAARDLTPAPNDEYCVKNSTKELVDAGKCTANLSAHGDRLAYVGVFVDSNRCHSGTDYTCGRPLMNLNVPAYCGPGTPNTCPQ